MNLNSIGLLSDHNIFKIAAGHNNLNRLPLHLINPSQFQGFKSGPEVLWNRSEETAIGGDGRRISIGLPWVRVNLSTIDHCEYSTIVSFTNGFDGLVSVRLANPEVGLWMDYNGVLRLPENEINGYILPDFSFEIRQLVGMPP